MRILRTWILHPFLIAAFPVIAFLSQNQDQIKPGSGLRALLACLFFAAILLAGYRFALRSWQKSAILTSLSLILFFSYGHIYGLLKETEFSGNLIGRHRILFPVWVILFLICVGWTARRWKSDSVGTELLNIFGMIALAFPLIQIAAFQIGLAAGQSAPAAVVEASSGLQPPGSRAKPDIYYIVLDGYTRDDTLAEEFSYDNSSFLEQLESMGFYIAYCSQSNYAQTELSLASSLNFNYLPALSDDIKSGATDRSPLWPLIRQSSIRTILENSGYLTVAFETGFYWTELDNANVYLSDSETSVLQSGPIGGLNILEAAFLKTTAALILSDATTKLPRAVSDVLNYPTRLHRERVLYDLEMLERMPATLETPKFVFAHIVSPHEPFVFGPNGEDIRLDDSLSRDEFVTAYRDQVHYLNQRLLDMLSQLISTSQTPPVIILQGDHGVASFSDDVRMKIFNAYYLPGAENDQPYSTISPVNTFRIILNSYFGNDFDLLDDTSYFSTYDDPYNFNVISDLRSCG